MPAQGQRSLPSSMTGLTTPRGLVVWKARAPRCCDAVAFGRSFGLLARKLSLREQFLLKLPALLHAELVNEDLDQLLLRGLRV